MMAYTTLAKIRAHRPCGTGWAKLLVYLEKTAADDACVTARRFTGRRHAVAAALSTVPESMRGPEWDLAAGHFDDLRMRGVL